MTEPIDDTIEPLPNPTRPNWLWRSLQVIGWVVFVLWMRYRIRGLRNISREGGGLILVNHQSMIDPILVQLGFKRPVCWIGRENLFRIPLFGWVIRNLLAIPIRRDSAGTAVIRETVRRLKHGFLVGIFPEGTRTKDGTVGVFKPGFIAIIRRSKTPVYPVGIAGAFEAMPRGVWFPRPWSVRVVIGEPIPFEEIEPLCARGREDDLLEFSRNRIVTVQQEAEDWLKNRRSR